jgi:cell surface protein SprA
MFKKTIFNIALMCLTIAIGGLLPTVAQQPSTPSAIQRDTIGPLRYPFKDQGNFDYPDQIDAGPLYMKQPSNIDFKVEYDPSIKQYILYEKVGNMYYRLPKTMSLEEYIEWDFNQSIQSYWKTRRNVDAMQNRASSGGLIPDIQIDSELFSNFFGSNVISIKPAGYVEVQFGLQSNYTNNPDISERTRRVTTFDFDQQVNMSVTGKIGDKVNMKVDYNTESTFKFENQINLDYTGTQDEILRKIEAGNVSLPLNGTLIQGGTNLFGFKTEMQFGKLNVTTVVSQHEGESQTVETKGGAQRTNFSVQASAYDENRHFFLSQYFRDNYENALRALPTVLSSVTINKIEVWVTNKKKDYSSARDILAFVDLGEQSKHISNNVPEFGAVVGNPYPANMIPHNKANNLYTQMTQNYPTIREASKINNALQSFEAYNFKGGADWEKIEQARKLESTEYTVNKQLGYISLNSALNNDEVLAVAFDFTINGVRYQVGEFSTDGIDAPNTLVLKLLKGVSLSPGSKTWDLMMKNIYNIGAYDLSNKDFELNIVYYNDSTGSYINYLPESRIKGNILLNVMHLDKLNSQLDPGRPDGVFDFVSGITVLPNSGRIIFPVLEPFGKLLRDSIMDPSMVNKYVYQSLYDSTRTYAEQDYERNKYRIQGSYKGSSGSEIALNAFNLAQGSVKVIAGGQQLTENTDYTVDYALGRVKIINEGLLESGTPIQVTTESQSLMSMKRKTLIGTYANYELSKKMNIGGTFMYMNERPITTKVDVGEEPISNLMLGLDMQYRDRSKLLTDLVNYIPFYNTKTESTISIESEVAKLFPGKSATTGNTVYIDDFEGAESNYSYLGESSWSLASIPQGQTNLFPESVFTDSIASGYNRARLSWYTIDPIFTRVKDPYMPTHIKGNIPMRSNHYMREVLIGEIYPGKQVAAGTPNRISTLDLAYFPFERGPFNYDTYPLSPYSAGVNPDGTLANPQSRWGGMMRQVQSTNFESANIEFIDFWLMDPFIYDKGTHQGGDLYFNLGNVSEDILRDSRKAFENGLPTSELVTNVDETTWGRVPNRQLLNQTFDSDPNSRKFQDVGLDGLGDEDERSFFGRFLEKLKEIVTPDTWEKANNDPSHDNFMYYRGAKQDELGLSIIDRYRYFNNTQGNSTETNASSTIKPDVEDINGDNTLSETESYYQYRVSMRKKDFVVGQNNIVEKATRTVKLADETRVEVDWYHFKIPVRKPDQTVGNIRDFKSIRFMRMFLTDFSDSIILRFATLNLVRSDWRKYDKDMIESGAAINPNTSFDVTTIDIEESKNRTPINYILPPNIDREIDPSNPQPIETNEQSMLMRVKDLAPGDSRGVYKSLGVDMRQYKRLIMDVHAEAIDGYNLANEELSLFVRMGSDFTNNYYEYEIPLYLTPVPASPYRDDQKNQADRYIVWPEENRMNINLSIFPDLKEARNAITRKTGATLRNTDEYAIADTEFSNGKNWIKIKGNPNLGEVQVLMIGVRNRLDKNTSHKSIEIWVNELRMADNDIKGGWASNSRMAVRLADLGALSLTGRTQSVGWGGISQTATERSLEDRYQLDFSANFELGKLFPAKAGIRLPMYYSYSRNVGNPEFSPLDPDIRMKDALDALGSAEERDAYKAIAQDFSERESFNLTNISIAPQRKNAERLPKPYDIENFSVSYAQNRELSHDIDIEYDIERNTKGVFNYNYMLQSKYIEPFKTIKALNNNYLQLIRDFNISLLPEMISFRTDMTRNYNERLTRNNTSPDFLMPVIVQKEMLWNRYFDFRFNPTRNLKLDFSNSNVLRIDEEDGAMNPNYPDEYKRMRRALYDSIMNLGRPVDYHHDINMTYNLPINKIPMLTWTSANVTYRGSYDWDAGPIMDTLEIGNTIQNSMNISFSTSLNFLTLYNKVPYLKKVNDKYQSTSRAYGTRARQQQTANKPQTPTTEPRRIKDVKFSEKKVEFKANVPKSIFHSLKTNNVKIIVLGPKGDTIQGTVSIVNEDRVNFTTKTNVSSATVIVNGKRAITESVAEKALEISTRMLMGVRTVRGTYTVSGGTVLPGFLPQPELFGGARYTAMGTNGIQSNLIAPTVPYMLGFWSSEYGQRFAEKGWVSKDTSLNNQYIYNLSNTYGVNINIEPIPNLRIDLTGSWLKADNNSAFIRFDNKENVIMQNQTQAGNFSMSIMTLRTAFSDKIGGDTASVKSAVFNQFLANREIIAQRLNAQRGYIPGVGYTNAPAGSQTEDGNGLTSTDVLIPAFLSAYMGVDAKDAELSAFPSVKWVRPNWRLTYNANPQQISWMTNLISSMNITHNYRATYTVGQFTKNLDYNEGPDGFSWIRGELNDNFIPKFDITSVSIQESFSPLINIDILFTNSLSTRFDIKKTRTLNLSLANNQLTEIFRNEFSVGLGYRFTGMDMILKTKNNSEKVSNDLNLMLDVTRNNNRTTLRKIVEGIEDVQTGSRDYTISFSADYMMSDKLTLRLFYDRTVADPMVNLYYRSTDKFGVSFKFSLLP